MIDEKKSKKQLINELVESRQRIIELETSVNQSMWAMEGMRECLQRHLDMQHIAHIGNWSWNLQTNELLWSDENHRLFGISREEVSHSFEAFLNYIHPDDIKYVRKAIDNALQGKNKCIIDFRILKPDGSERYVNARAVVAFDEAGKPIRMTGTLQDITERKKTEKKLRLFRDWIDRSNDAITVIDPETGNILDSNYKAYSSLGYTREELLNMRISDFLVDLPDWEKHVKDIQKSGNLILEAHPRRKDGTTFPVEANVDFLGCREKSYIVAIVRDITERKQAEKALQESEEKFRSIATVALDAIVSMDESGRIYYMNKTGERLFGYTAEEVIGKELHTLLVPDKYHDAYKKGFDIFKATGKGKVIGKIQEFSAIRKDGTEFSVEISVSALRIQGKWHAVGLIRDITDRKKAEEMRLEKERLEYASRAKSDFIASMSHELRTPLNAVIGFSELLGQKTAGELNETQEKYVNNILTSGKFLLNLINDILDLSKIETGKIELAPENISVPATIQETLSLIYDKATKHDVLLKTEFDTELEFIEADRQRFKQILFNLLSNAVKFSKDEGGTVTIKAKRDGNMAKFSVSDTGIGIKEENIGRLFHKFEQLDSRMSEKYGGTGLGLAITKQLVELHGGNIWAESTYGEGSTFAFLIPLVGKKGLIG